MNYRVDKSKVGSPKSCSIVAAILVLTIKLEGVLDDVIIALDSLEYLANFIVL